MSNVVSIHIADRESEPTRRVAQIRAVAGKGLEGDRYFDILAKDGNAKKTGRHATLIEAEALDALTREYGVTLAPEESRRNLITRGVALNHLVGVEFQVGEAVLRGMRLCEPCEHLERMTRPGVRKGLIHRGGLRAEVVRDGLICEGDAIRPISGASSPV